MLIIFQFTGTTAKKRVVNFKQPGNNKRLKFCQCISEGLVRGDDGNGSISAVPKSAEAEEKEILFNTDLLGESGAGKVLYVRDCYRGLFAEIEAQRSAGKVGGAVVTGTPGIGKTMCSAYFIHRYMELGTTILLKFRNEGYFLFSKSKKWECDDFSYELNDTLPEGQAYHIGKLAIASELAEYLKNLKDVVYIVDLNQEKFDESLPTAFLIILTSANKEKYASAVSSGSKTVIILWMPVWSLEEIRRHAIPINRLAERYAIHGGVLRYLLWEEERAKSDLKTILDASTSTAFLLALDKDCKDANISGRLVHYKLAVENDYLNSKAVFASKHIRDRVAQRFFLRERLSFQVTVDKMKFDNSFGGPRGVLSELVWHHQLRDGGNFRMKTLASGVAEKEEVTELNVPKLLGDVVTCEQDMRDLLEFPEDDYVSPFGNLPAVDSFMVTKTPFFDLKNDNKDLFLVGFQMAGSKKREHWLKGARVTEWIAIAKKAHPTISKVVIVFVVNTEDLDGWKEQAFKTKDAKGQWKNYLKLPGDLAMVQQIGLGMPPEERKLE